MEVAHLLDVLITDVLIPDIVCIRYRYYLAQNKRAIAKFVKCVNWSVAVEAEQAMELIRFYSIFCSSFYLLFVF